MWWGLSSKFDIVIHCGIEMKEKKKRRITSHMVLDLAYLYFRMHLSFSLQSKDYVLSFLTIGSFLIFVNITEIPFFYFSLLLAAVFCWRQLVRVWFLSHPFSLIESDFDQPKPKINRRRKESKLRIKCILVIYKNWEKISRKMPIFSEKDPICKEK